MAQALTPTVSHELYLAILRENPDLNIERTARGELVIVPPAGWRTSVRNMEIASQLKAWNDRAGLGAVTGPDGGYVLPNGATRAPDAAWTSNERLAAIPAAQREAFAPVTPDFAVELRSQSDGLSELQAKMREYVQNGVRLAWLIDPKRRVVEIYRPALEPEVLLNIAELDGEEVLPGFKLDLGLIFSD